MPDHEIVRVSLPRHVYVLAALFGVLMLGMLVAQWVLMEDQRTTTDEQLEITARQSAQAMPILKAVRPLVTDVDEALPEAGRLGAAAQTLADDAIPLVRELRNARAGENIRAAGSLAAVLLEADVGDATRDARNLAQELLRADMPRLAEVVRSGLPRATFNTERLADFLPEQRRLLRRSVAVQEETLAVQKRALALIEATLAVAKEAEGHAESLDNKTGGSIPPAGG